MTSNFLKNTKKNIDLFDKNLKFYLSKDEKMKILKNKIKYIEKYEALEKKVHDD